MYELSKSLIDENKSIKDALKKIDDSGYGFIFSKNTNNEVTGLITDGDIRRALLKGATLNAKISDWVNKKFLWSIEGAPREELIKHLDSQIQFIPILDHKKRLKNIFSNEYFPLADDNEIYIRSRAPVRVSFGGGGSDLTHYFKDKDGAVINAAISIYSHALMRLRKDTKIIINSDDLKSSFAADTLEDALKRKDGDFGLIQSILYVIKPKFGFELSLNSDFSIGSGLGGSATLCAAILGCFNELRHDKWTQYEIAEIAFQAERLRLGIAGGWQDQYASVFGGFNFIEFSSKENIVNSIKINKKIISELEENLILCDTGINHNSGNIHKDQKETMSSTQIKEMVNQNVEITYNIRKYLLKGDLPKLGQALDAGWNLKKNFSNMISNDKIDKIYNGAIKNGAIGGKLLGAGGGGYFLFYVSPYNKYRLLDYLKSSGLKVTPFRFEDEGIKSWTFRNDS